MRSMCIYTSVYVYMERKRERHRVRESNCRRIVRVMIQCQSLVAASQLAHPVTVDSTVPAFAIGALIQDIRVARLGDLKQWPAAIAFLRELKGPGHCACSRRKEQKDNPLHVGHVMGQMLAEMIHLHVEHGKEQVPKSISST